MRRGLELGSSNISLPATKPLWKFEWPDSCNQEPPSGYVQSYGKLLSPGAEKLPIHPPCSCKSLQVHSSAHAAPQLSLHPWETAWTPPIQSAYSRISPASAAPPSTHSFLSSPSSSTPLQSSPATQSLPPPMAAASAAMGGASSAPPDPGRGPRRAATRLGKQFCSLSPFFEVFVCQIYANAVQQDLSFGGARYIGTGRGFATARIPFGILYSRFAGPSIYLGARSLMMLLFATLTVWQPALIYFWVTLLAMCASPFIYNPHQFAWNDFFIDYRDFLRWLSRGNSRSHASSWIAFCRLSRTRITGYKRKVLGDPSSKMSGDVPRASFANLFFGEIIGPLLMVAVTLVPYIFINSQIGVSHRSNPDFDDTNTATFHPTAALVRVAIVAFAPIAINAGVLGAMFGMACCMGPVLSMCCKKFGSVLAAIAHAVAVIILLVMFEVMFFLEDLSFAKALLGMIAATALQRFVFKLIISLALTREMKTDTSNIAFWTGKWYSMGWHSMSQPAREFLCKITELGMFAGDFVLGHVLLFVMLPVIIIPQVDKAHSVMLFWLRPSRQIRPPIYSLKQSKLRKRRVFRYAVMYFVMLVIFLALIVGPIVAGSGIIPSSLSKQQIAGMYLFQPHNLSNNDTQGTLATGTGSASGGAKQTAAGSAGARVRLF